MAFIPDICFMDAKTELVSKKGEIKHAALLLYGYYCMRRSRHNGTCFPSLKKTSADLGINYTYTSELKTFLVDKKWIEITKQGEIRPLKGFGLSEESGSESSDKPKSSSDKPKSSSDKPKSSSDKPKGTDFAFKGNINQPIQPAHSTSPFKQPDDERSVSSSGANTKRLLGSDETETNPPDETDVSKIVPEVKNEDKQSKQRARKKRGSRIPEDFSVTDEMRDWAKKETPNVEIERATAEFTDYWKSVSARATKLDWELTWKNRLRELQRRFDENQRRIDAWRQQREKENRNGKHGKKPDNQDRIAEWQEYIAQNLGENS